MTTKIKGAEYNIPKPVIKPKEELSPEQWSKTFHNDDIKLIAENFKKRLSGAITDEEWKSFMETIKETANPNYSLSLNSKKK